jgi:hypothetical protein
VSDEPIETRFAILAPVPSAILREAITEAKPLVAFGSDLDSLWGTDELGEPRLARGRYRVLIYESHHDPKDAELGVTFEGVVEGWTRWEDASAGQRACRPENAALTDTTWAFLWLVSGLQARPLIRFRFITPAGRGEPPLSTAFIPHGPLRVVVADDAAFTG